MSCGRCDHGWVSATEKYVEQQLAKSRIHQSTEDEEVKAKHLAALEADLRNTVYPCKDCRPDEFYAWVARRGERPVQQTPKDRSVDRARKALDAEHEVNRYGDK